MVFKKQEEPTQEAPEVGIGKQAELWVEERAVEFVSVASKLEVTTNELLNKIADKLVELKKRISE